jgi:F-type H+-transporting ATPase subunit epsilon
MRMKLEVLLPWRVFVEPVEVARIVAESAEGSFGLLPHRLDCVAALVPGILIYETDSGDEVFVAVDDGILIKTGARVRISVRRALAGRNLESLRRTVEQEFLNRDEHEQDMRSVMAGLEIGFMRRLAQFQHE